MSSLRGTSSTVRQVAIAAMLGALPSIAAAQVTRDTTVRPASDSELTGLRRIAARAIPRGALLTAADIAYAADARPKHVVPHSVALLDTIPRPASQADTLIGWTARRMIAAGELLRAPAIIPPQLVKAGDLVELQWQDGSILITTKGRATKSASVGERVMVRLTPQQSIEGSVVGAGRVRVD